MTVVLFLIILEIQKGSPSPFSIKHKIVFIIKSWLKLMLSVSLVPNSFSVVLLSIGTPSSSISLPSPGTRQNWKTAIPHMMEWEWLSHRKPWWSQTDNVPFCGRPSMMLLAYPSSSGVRDRATVPSMHKTGPRELFSPLHGHQHCSCLLSVFIFWIYSC